MRPVAPRLPGAPEVTLAEEQEQYQPITAAMVFVPHPTLEGRIARGAVMRWRLDESDLARLAAGEDLYLQLLTFGSPMQPVMLCVGVPPHLEGG